MKIRTVTFQASAPDLSSCPQSSWPEFALIGRSNVGKSSLINTITRSQKLAKVSATPGKTRLINFFSINNTWSLVDLPGYGYAQIARKEREKFSTSVAEFLQHRSNLLGTLVLIDSQLSPQKIDCEFLEWMVECQLPFALVFTKIDKIPRATVEKNIAAFLYRLREISEDDPVILTSSSKLGHGRTEILSLIASALPTSQQ